MPPATSPTPETPAATSPYASFGGVGIVGGGQPSMTGQLGNNGAELKAEADAYLGLLSNESHIHSGGWAGSSASADSVRKAATFLRLGLAPLVFVIVVIVWAASGGWSSMQAGKVAHVPVPAHSQLATTVAEVTRGPFGPLPQDRVKLYATRVFTVPMSSSAARGYYVSGPGAAELKKGGWTMRSAYVSPFGNGSQEWVRVAAIGFRAQEEQTLDLTFSEKSKLFDTNNLTVPQGYSIVCASCQNDMGLEKVDFPEK